MTDESHPKPRRRGPAAKMLRACLGLLIGLALLELGCRVVFAIRVGPSVLVYGTGSTRLYMDPTAVGNPDEAGVGYTKYRPNQKRVDLDRLTGERFDVTINGRGFRGPDFPSEKEPGSIRVLNLGASSTFGYHSRDTETYPHLLEEILDGSGGGPGRFEVINLGIPHLQSAEILALFLAEGLPLDPDVVTFYEGYNDNLSPPEEAGGEDPGKLRQSLRPKGILVQLYRQLRARLLFVAYVDGLVLPKGRVDFTEERLAAHMEGRSGRLLANLTRMRDACRERGVLFIATSQQSQSLIVPDHRDLRGISFDEELEMVRRKLSEEGSLTMREAHFVAHHRMMRDLESWALDEGGPYADVIEALDERRDCLVSWVHLSPEGNRMVAEALAGEILSRVR